MTLNGIITFILRYFT